MANNSYTIEYAKSARSTCKNSKCKQKIEKDIIRVGKKFPSSRFTDDGEQVDWYHLNCVFDYLSRARKNTKKIEAVEDLIGYDHLGDSDQKLVKRVINGERPPEGGPAGSGGGGGAGKSSTADKPKKTTKKKATEETKTTVQLKGNGKVITITDASTTLGRGDETGYHDKRCSRNQLELQYNETTQKLVVIRRGSNPSSLMKEGEESVVMDKDIPYQVNDGDSFGLILDECPFTVHIKKETIEVPKPAKPKTTKPKKPKDPATKSESTSTPTKKKKKKGGKSDEDDEEEDENEPNEYDMNDPFIDTTYKDMDEDADYDDSKQSRDDDADEDFRELQREAKSFMKHQDNTLKRKYGDSDDEKEQVETKDGKPVCRYGAHCYRKNPDHSKQFWHPPKPEPKTTSVKSEPAPKSTSKSSLHNSGHHTASSEEEPSKLSNSQNKKQKTVGIDMKSATLVMDAMPDLSENEEEQKPLTKSKSLPKKPNSIDMDAATQALDMDYDKSDDNTDDEQYPKDLEKKLNELRNVFSHSTSVLLKHLKANGYDVEKTTNAIMDTDQ